MPVLILCIPFFLMFTLFPHNTFNKSLVTPASATSNTANEVLLTVTSSDQHLCFKDILVTFCYIRGFF